MKILYSCLSKSWGGMEMYSLTSLKQLLKRNIKVELLCIAGSRIHIEANALGLIIHPVKGSGYFRPYTTLKIAALIRKNSYDLIHAQYSKDLWVIVPALKILNSRIPLILTKHLGSFIVKKDFLHSWIYSRVTIALAISRVIKDNLAATTPLSSDKIEILHNGIDLNIFDPEKTTGKKVRQEFGICDSEILIGMLGRFSPGKGHEEFLAAAENLSSKYNNLKFIIVGEASRGENQYAELIKKAAAEKKLDKVIFAGYRSDIPGIIAAFDIFIFPSHAEAFGIALLEAMAMGKPCVASNSDGVLDLIIDNESGLLFENKNPIDLEIKVEALINSRAKAKELQIAARKRAIENFDIETQTDKVINIYGKLTHKRII